MDWPIESFLMAKVCKLSVLATSFCELVWDIRPQNPSTEYLQLSSTKMLLKILEVIVF